MDSGNSLLMRELAETTRALCAELWSERWAGRSWQIKSGRRQAEWDRLVDLGVPDLTVPQTAGGTGLGWSALGAVFQAIGTAPVAVPVLDTCAARPLLAAAFKSDRDRDRILAMAGRVSIVDPAVVQPQPSDAELTVRDGLLSGVATLVRFPADATLFAVIIQAAGSARFLLVDPLAVGVSVSAMRSADPFTEYGSVQFADVRPVAVPDALGGAELAGQLRAACRILAACEMSGIVSHLVRLSVDYAKLRSQFGVPIGSFQAVQHGLARMHVDSEGLASLVRMVCADADHDERLSPVGAAMAKALAAESGRTIAEAAVQVHGGIAFTAEYEINPYLRHVLSLQGICGDEHENYYDIGLQLLNGGRECSGEAGG